MTEDRDPFIQNLFAEKQADIQDDEFTEAVLARVNGLKRRLLYLLLGSLVVFFACSLLFSWPILGVFTALTQILGTEIFYIGDAAVAMFLSPINNIATFLVIIWRIVRFGWSRATQASYVS